MFIITKISLTSTLILAISVIAKMLGILDGKYVTMTLYVTLVIQALLLLVVIHILIIRRRKMTGIRIVRYQLHDTPVKGETNIIPEKIFPTNPRKSAQFKIFLEIDNVSEIPEVGISKIAAEKIILDINNHIININSSIVNHNFIFDADVIVSPGEEINFQIKKDTFIKVFFLGEYYTP